VPIKKHFYTYKQQPFNSHKKKRQKICISTAIAALLLVILIASIAVAVYGWLAKKPFSKTTKTMALLGMTASHLQFLMGMILYFLSPLGMSNFSGAAMKNAITRLYIVEHPIMMIIGVALITIGYMKAKRLTDDNRKFKTLALFYSLGLLFFLSRIPWATWTL